MNDRATLFQWVRQLDRFTAEAFDIPKEARHQDHDAALDKCAGFLIWVDTKLPQTEVIIAMFDRVRLYFNGILGGIAWQGYAERNRRFRELIAAFQQFNRTPTT